jgi:nucleoside-diphosphate-sugar epimerase
MRVFVTGATGYIGSAIVRACVKAGHGVTGLVRSPEKQRALEAAGGVAVLGDYKDVETYAQAALACDAVIHAAMEYSPEGVLGGEKSMLALAGLRQRRAGGAGAIVFTSGVWVLGETPDPADESASTDHPAPAVAWRVGQEKALLAANGEGLAVSVIRPGMVYGHKGGFIADWFAGAEEAGAVSFVGDGANRWSMVHVDDVANLYRLVVEKKASGIFHGVDGTPARVADLAKAASLAAGTDGKTKSVSVEAARAKMGPMADAVVMDQVVVTKRSRELGWKPAHASFEESAKAAYGEWRP